MGDPVTSIGGCQVTNIRDWNGCLAQSMREQSYGNCVPVNMIEELDTARKKKLGKYPYVLNIETWVCHNNILVKTD